MDVTLIFPPHWAPFQPYLSLPTLTGFLRKEGYHVTQRDVNIEAMDYFTSTFSVKNIYKKIRERVKLLKTIENRSEKEEMELECLSLCEHGYDVTRQSRISKDIMRDASKFFDFNLYKVASLVLLDVYLSFGHSSYPAIVDFYTLMEEYSSYSTQGIMDALNNMEHNIYAEFLRNVTLPSLKENPSDFYGISISAFSQMIPGMTLAKLIKEHIPSAHVCLGGNVITRIGPRLMPSSPLFEFFDSAILYEGEIPLVELLRAIEGGRDFKEVPSIIYKDKNGTQIFNEYYREPDVNSIPSPDFSGLPFEKYLSPFKIGSIMSARGCYWNKCAFCQHRYTYRGKYRPRNMSLVIDDMELLNREGIKYFSFCDEAVPPVRLRELAKGILDRNLNVVWEAYARVEKSFDKELAELLYKAGCRSLAFGLESSVPRVLELMCKGHRPEVFEQVLRASSDAGIWNYAWFFTGFPSETKDEAMSTADFIIKNQDIIHSVTLNAVFGLEEYTDIVKYPEKYYLSEVKNVEGNDLSFVYDYSVKSGLSPEEARKLSREIYMKILTEHRHGPVMANVSRIHQLLYKDHYGTNDLSPYTREQ